MENNVKTLKAGITAFFAALTTLWGWFGWLCVAWIILMCLDVLTGMAAGLKAGEWSSQVAREGLLHKAGCICAVIVAGVLDMVIGQLVGNLPNVTLPFEYTVLLCPLVVTWYILTEAGSIIENTGKMGAEYPDWLKNAIAVLKSKVDDTGKTNTKKK